MVARLPEIDDPLRRALVASGESRELDFKGSFDPSNGGEWCEILKDIAAMANSGGGLLLVGLDDQGAPTGRDMRAVVSTDAAKFADKIRSYTGEDFDRVSVEEAQKDGHAIAVIRIGGAKTPLVFTKPGTYLDPSDPTKKDQKTAFGKGTIYFRHGAKSEPGTTADLRRWIDGEVRELRREMQQGVRKVVRAPRGSRIEVVRAVPARRSTAPAQFVRAVADPHAPEARLRSPDVDFPFLGKELIARVNERLAGRGVMNSHDLLCVRRAHGIDSSRPDFHYKSRTSLRQYSPAFLDWIAAQFEADPEFFRKAREVWRVASEAPRRSSTAVGPGLEPRS